jgi:hypothetical protein
MSRLLKNCRYREKIIINLLCYLLFIIFYLLQTPVINSFIATLKTGGTLYELIHSLSMTPGSTEKALTHHLNQLSKGERFAIRKKIEDLIQTQEAVSSEDDHEYELLMKELLVGDEEYMRLFKELPGSIDYKTDGDLVAEIDKLGKMQKALLAIKKERDMAPQLKVWETIISRIETIEGIKRRRGESSFSSSSSSSGGRQNFLSPDRVGMPITATAATAVQVQVADVEEKASEDDEA